MSAHWRDCSGLSAVVVFLIFATLTAVFIGTLLFFPGQMLDWVWQLNPEGRAAFQSMGRLSSLLLFVVAAVAGGAAIGIRRRRKWGWRLAILLFSVNGLGDLVSLFVTGRILQGASGVLIAGLFLAYLLRTDVRQEFREQSV